MKKLRITIGDQSYDVTVERLDDGQPDQRSASAPARPAAIAPPPAKRAAPSPTPSANLASGEITSPMAGVVLSVGVSEGDTVDKDRVLLILEAMKMENQILAPGPATVKKICVKAGESVQEAQLLIELE